ncbi:MAG: AsmA family protein [Bacteroidetes bacterium]|nr:AsmA family protein [Bacteroidota bacterium]
MKKAVKITGISLGAVLLLLILMLLSPFIFKDKLGAIIKTTANKTLKTELNFSAMDVSFFTYFPNLTITLSDFSLKSSAPFNKDTLIKAKDVSFGVNLWSVFKGPLKITRVYLVKGKVVLQYNEKGASNFDVYASSSDTVKQTGTTSSGEAEIKIESIAFVKTDLTYSDASIPLKITAHGINYRGKSNLSKDILKLASNVQIDSLDLEYNHVNYIKSKPVKAKLVTSININSLDMKFEKNDLTLKNIPFEFRGEFGFKKEGYELFLSLFSMYNDEYISGSLRMISTKKLWIAAKADVNMNLRDWGLGLGMKDFELRGIYSLKFDAQGDYYTGRDPKSKKSDTVILSIPNFNLVSTLKDGFFRYKKYPQALSDITAKLTASCKDHDYRSVKVSLDDLKAGFLKNKIEGYFRLNGLADLPVEGSIKTSVNLAEMRQLIPIDSLDFGGVIDIKLDVKGNYAPEKKLFPLTILSVKLNDGDIQTKYYPHPIDRINMSLIVTNISGKLSDTRVVLDPFSFRFEGKPFEIKASLANPDNISYDIVSKGSVDLARVYKVFSHKGMDLGGYIETDLKLKGSQSDAMAGRIGKLSNSGRLTLRNIAFTSEYLPKPFIVKSGVFRFDQDKVWFEKFDGRYGASDIMMDGHLSNVINYVLSDKSDKQVLKGNFNFNSDYLLADEFIPGEGSGKQGAGSGKPAAGSQQPETKAQGTGVIIIPENLEIGLKANLKKVGYSKLEIHDLTAAVELKQGMLLLKDMKFELIGCKVDMDATYGSLNPTKAFFDFHIVANDFDIKRAYNEVEMFRNISTSAGKCEGIVSLDYTLKGKLDAGMNPVYPSLEGGGVLSLKKIKVMGLKLFTDMSKNLQKEKIKDPNLSKVDLKTTIKNNVITLDKTKMKISGFRLRIEGESNFNGSINAKARLGLPPLGIFGINMRLLGTMDNPKFKYGKGSGDGDVDETQYTDEIPKEMLDKIKNAKEEDLKDEPQ